MTEIIGQDVIDRLRETGVAWFIDYKDAGILLERDEFLVKRKERLELTLRLLQQKESMTACCTICWTFSWEPCDADTEDAIADPYRTGEYMVCEMCALIKFHERMRADIAEARRLIGFMTNAKIAEATKILDKYKDFRELQSEDSTSSTA